MKQSEIFEIHRKLDLVLRTLGVDPDVNKPQGEYCLVTSDLWLFFHGGYYDCLEYLSWIRGVQLEMMTLAAYNQALDAAGYEPFKFDRK
jgi:hypothetical protein